MQARYNLGVALDMRGRFNEAVVQYQEFVRITPGDATAHRNLGNSLVRCGRPSEASVHFRRACELRPEWPEPLNSLAWLLATCPDPDLRNGAEAVGLATRCCELTRYEHPGAMDTLAAAYAETGRFAEARDWARRAIDLATRQDQKALADQIRARLRLYESSRAFHETP